MLECGPKLVANPEHLALLRQGVNGWNAWRGKELSIRPDLSGAELIRANLQGAHLSQAHLNGANLSGANLSQARLYDADLSGAHLVDVDFDGRPFNDTNLSGANLGRANLSETNFSRTNFSGANLSGANLSGANLSQANLSGAKLSQARLYEADLSWADLSQTDLSQAHLFRANLSHADLSRADLSRADLSEAGLVETSLVDAALTDCRIYGISAWNVKLSEGTKQHGLIITPVDEPAVTVDDLEVAQFVYLLLHNEKIRNIIDTVGKKGVLLLGRFTEGRIAVLERLRDELRKRGYLPIVFNFDKPETKDFTETVRLLAGLSKFVIADITNPKSAPLELQATVPEIMVPFRPIIEEGEKPFAMLQDLWSKHREWVFEPIYYSSVDALIASLDEKIIQPAEARFVELVKRKADAMGGEHV
jgi:uncharacterized protein YjbI with pentapeptide repeats